MNKLKKKKPTVQTVIDDVYVKLADLLSESGFRTSADVIERFEKAYPDDWKTLIAKFGHRDDEPGKKNRGHYYAASTYLADRLAAMKRMGSVELKYTLDFDTKVWKHNKRMGTWRLIQRPEPTVGGWKFLTVRVPGEIYEKLSARAIEGSVSVSTLATRAVVETDLAKDKLASDSIAERLAEWADLLDAFAGDFDEKEATRRTQMLSQQLRNESDWWDSRHNL